MKILQSSIYVRVYVRRFACTYILKNLEAVGEFNTMWVDVRRRKSVGVWV